MIKNLLVILILLSLHIYAQDPRELANLKEGQPYQEAKLSLEKAGYIPGENNQTIKEAKPHPTHKEVTCGKHMNHFTNKSVYKCSVLFENKKEVGMIMLFLKKDKKQGLVLLDPY